MKNILAIILLTLSTAACATEVPKETFVVPQKQVSTETKVTDGKSTTTITITLYDKIVSKDLVVTNEKGEVVGKGAVTNVTNPATGATLDMSGAHAYEVAVNEMGAATEESKAAKEKADAATLEEAHAKAEKEAATLKALNAATATAEAATLKLAEAEKKYQAAVDFRILKEKELANAKVAEAKAATRLATAKKYLEVALAKLKSVVARASETTEHAVKNAGITIKKYWVAIKEVQ